MRLARSLAALAVSSVLARVGRPLEGFAAALDTRGEVRVPREILLALRVGSLGFAALTLAQAMGGAGATWERVMWAACALFWVRLGFRAHGEDA